MPAAALLVLLLVVLPFLSPAPAGALVCGAPGSSGPGFPSGMVNDYWPGSGSPAPGSGAVNLGPRRGAGAGDTIQAGDLVLIIQMQDADIDSSNTADYGGNDGSGSGATALNSAGLYEYVLATNSVGAGGGTLTFTPALTNGYRHRDATGSYGRSRWQAVRVPQYSSATASNVTAPTWNGDTGGVVALDVQGTLTLGGGTAIDVAGLGFRGGAGRQLGGGAGADTDFRTLATTDTNGGKGEGIAGTPRYLNDTTAYNAAPTLFDTGSEGYPNGSYARGAPGNAGGGGTDGNPSANNENSGGGGGSNYGFGGQGGDAWNSGDPSGGRGGGAFSGALSPSRIFLGGGGGAGTTNNGTGDGATYITPPGVPCTAGNGLCSSGAAGGGIVLIRAGSINGGGAIRAQGADAYNVANDGGGGGGGGGTVVLQTYFGGNATVDVSGGNGGNTWRDRDTLINRHGPGGGGGGGFIAYSPSSGFAVSADYAAGLSGLSSNDDPFGSTSGNGGFATFDLPDVPGIEPGFLCQPAVKAVSLAIDNGTTGVVDPGDTVEYTIVYHNVSNGPITGFNIIDTLDGNLTYVDGSLAVTPTDGASGSANPAYDGTAVTTLLASNVTLPAGGVLTATLQATADAPSCSDIFNQADSIQAGGEVLGPTDNADNTQNSDGLPAGTYIDQAPYGTGGTTDPTGFTMVCPDLSGSTKTWTDLNGGDQQPGDVLRYTITLPNSGGGSASGVSVTDDIPDHVNSFTVVSLPAGATDQSTFAGTGANGNGYLDTTGIDVPAGGSVEIVFDVTINNGAAVGTTIDNSAVITNPSGPGATPAASQVTVRNSFSPISGTKLLYLHENPQVLSRTPLDPTWDRVEIDRDEAETWELEPAAAADITIDPAVNATVPVYLVLRADDRDGNRTVQVDLQCSSGGPVLTDTRTVDLDDNNRQEVRFDLTSATPPWSSPVTCGAGERWELTVTNDDSGPNDQMRVYMNRDGVSRVELPAATVINVDSIDLYDAPYPGGNSLTAAAPGRTVYIRAAVSDPFGSFDISGAALTLTDGAGTTRVNGAAMTEVADDGNALKIYEYSYAIPAGEPNGTWSVEVEADEGTEGTISDLGNSAFAVEPISDLSTSTKTVLDLSGGDANPGDVLRYTITLEETAGIEATDVTVTDDIPGDLTAFSMVSIPPGASDNSSASGGAYGSGYLEVAGITVPAGGSTEIVFEVTIAAGAAPGTSIDNTADIANPAGVGATPAAGGIIVSASDIPGTGNKPLYLDGDGGSPGPLTRATTGSTDIVDIDRRNSRFDPTVETWTLDPPLATDMVLDGAASPAEVQVNLWLASEDDGFLAVQLTCGGIDLSGWTYIGNSDGDWFQASFTLPYSGSPTCAQGENWGLSISNYTNRTLQVDPDRNGTRSRVILPSATVINVDSITVFDDVDYPGGTALASVAPGTPIRIRATVSDPFGHADITAARIEVTDPAGTVVVSGDAMTEVAASGAEKTYEYQYTVPAGGPPGNWTVRVDADEGTEGEVSDFALATFAVTGPPNLTVVKSASGTTAAPGTDITYTVQVINTGAGPATNVRLTDDLSPYTAWSLAAYGAGQPFQLVQGSPASGLTLGSAEFSDDEGATWTYTPASGAGGAPGDYDGNVTNWRLPMTGTMPAGGSFTLRYQVRVK